MSIEKQVDNLINRYYSFELLEMCKDLGVDHVWSLVRYRHIIHSPKWEFCASTPNFYSLLTCGYEVQTALGVVKDKPVFKGDILYDSRDATCTPYEVVDINNGVMRVLEYGEEKLWFSWKVNARWNKPETDTFKINEFDCPKTINNGQFPAVIACPYSDNVITLTFASDKDRHRAMEVLYTIFKNS